MSQQPTPGTPGTTAAAPSPGAGVVAAQREALLQKREAARRERDADLAEHDLSDHDEPIFRTPRRPWPHLRRLGLALLLLGLLTTGVAAVHLGSMSGGTIAHAVLLPDKTPVNLRLAAGEQRMLYAQRGSDSEITRCTVTDGHDDAISVQHTTPVILSGSDALWHGQSMFTAPRDDDYTVTCSSGRPDRMVRIGRPVGMWDVGLTLAATGLGGICLLAGAGLLVARLAARRRSA